MNELLAYAVSSADISKITGNNNIIPYRKIKLYNTIDDLLGTNNACFILYETEYYYGHWVLVSRSGNLIEHFDSYGYKPEAEKTFITNKNLIEPINYLNILLKNSPYQVSYNEFPLQILDDSIGTCGKWVMLRYFLKDMCLYDFKNMLFNDMKKINCKYPDIFVCLIFKYNYNI
jgi:hypothetical protein